MGWGRNFLLGSLGVQMDIKEVREEVKRLRQVEYAADANIEHRLDRIEDEVRELSLSFISLVNLLVANGVVREKSIHRIIEQLDPGEDAPEGFDGKIDFSALARDRAQELAAEEAGEASKADAAAEATRKADAD